MFKQSVLTRSLLLAFGGGMAMSAGSVWAQETQRVEITGSSIKRIDAEGALPVQILKKEDIVKTGATNVTDLLQRLPAVQGSTNEGSAVGGETFGFAGVSLHNLTEQRTLVLLNGHRISKFSGQTVTGAQNAIDLNTLPISAIERVEILTDGASALYGADAVAGVVNFITVRNSTDGVMTAGHSKPTQGGSTESRVAFTKGFGNYDADGYNVMVTLSYDKRSNLQATQRQFAQTGLVSHVDDKGEIVGPSLANATSKRSIPANLNLYDGDGNQVVRLNPALVANGNCPEFHAKSGTSCRYDFTSQLEIYPDRERTNAYLTFDRKLAQDWKWTNELLLSNTKSTSRIAPPPGELPIQVGTASYTQALALAKSQGYYPTGVTPGAGDPAVVGTFDPATMDANLRFTELGKRTNVNEISLFHFVSGLEGSFNGWDVNASLTHSQNRAKDTFGGGYATVSGVASSTYLGFNPLLGLGQQSAAGQSALNAAKLSGYWNGGLSKLDAITVQGSREIGRLEGGAIQLGLGASFQNESLDAKPGDVLSGRVTYQTDVNNQPCLASGLPCVGTAIDQRFGDSGITPAYSASRRTYGLFAELVAPVNKVVELTGSVRADRTNDFGSSLNGKLALRVRPSKELLLRASAGTGYLAPSIAQVNAPVQNYGVTTNAYSCSGDAASDALQALATSKGVLCDDGAQFQQFASGFKGLKPEKSKQLTLGFVFEPTAHISVGADLWSVFISDAIGQKAEQLVFSDPTKYSKYFTTFVDPTTGKKLLAVLLPNENLGNSITTGIDFNLSAKYQFSGMKLTSNLVATYLLKSVAQTDKGSEYLSDLAGKDGQGTISVLWQGRWSNTLESGPWGVTAAVNFRSGYVDNPTDVVVMANAAAGNSVGTAINGYRHAVPYFATLDLLGRYDISKQFTVVAGALNVTGRTPPFVFSQGGIGRGQEVGWDGRYYDPRGRTLYVNAQYKF